MFRARNYNNHKQYAKALSDYNQALAHSHKGWIHMERGRFFLMLKEYDLAIRDARAAKDETPTLTYQADQILQVAGNQLEARYLAEHPPEILLTKQAPRKRTRFDVALEHSANSPHSDSGFIAWRKKRDAQKKASATPKRRAKS